MRPDDLAPKTGEIIIRVRFRNHDEGIATWADLEEYIRNRLWSPPQSPFTTTPYSFEERFEMVGPGNPVGPGRRYVDNVWQNVMDDEGDA